MDEDHFGPSVIVDVVRYAAGRFERVNATVATEVPLTLVVNGDELATLMCSPSDLRQFCYGFLFTSGLINRAADVKSLSLDETRWRAEVLIERKPDPAMLDKRVYTSGCGRGVMYTTILELSARQPLVNDFTVSPDFVIGCMKWLQESSPLHRITGGVHTVAFSIESRTPEKSFDDIGRHNAVDKVIGHLLLEGVETSKLILICTGRISSEVLHKAKRAAIPILLSRAAPTHQTILLARDMGITVIGFARGGQFKVYSHERRVDYKPTYRV
ncbi:MAG: formate dehydrogenase family accessory protein FdhD [Deltaproteobacteria bacterium HGW-Deltaproteobacteria-21]|nr:MAG: formate dehydrogenase family accessory protein FdhD [Deltaproteobacteria bacterium HGW-Deltaproteobacteria-21]